MTTYLDYLWLRCRLYGRGLYDKLLVRITLQLHPDHLQLLR